MQFVTALAFGTSAAHAATINVPGDQPTIQAAIDAASPGDVVIVAAGTYYENLILNSPLDFTLQGAQQGVPACDRVTLETIVQAADPDSPVLDITNGAFVGAVIDGFTFDSGGGNPIACVLQRFGDTPGLQFLNNRLLGFQNSGLRFDSSADDAIIRGNDIDGSTTNASGSLLFLSTNTYNGIQIDQNCLHNSHLYGLFVDGNRNVGIGTTPPLISRNIFRANNTGANTGSRSLLSATIMSNTLADNTGTGWQGGPKLCTFFWNSFANNGISGLALTSFGNTAADHGAQDCTITENSFVGNVSEGIFYSASQAAGTISTNVANNNDFSGTTVGARYDGTETIDLKCNWWNSLGGPNYPPSNVNAPGAGIVGSNMLYVLWLEFPSYIGGGCNQPPPTGTARHTWGRLKSIYR